FSPFSNGHCCSLICYSPPFSGKRAFSLSHQNWGCYPLSLMNGGCFSPFSPKRGLLFPLFSHQRELLYSLFSFLFFPFLSQIVNLCLFIFYLFYIIMLYEYIYIFFAFIIQCKFVSFFPHIFYHNMY